MKGKEELKNKKVAVIGLGARTGLSLLRFLNETGAHVYAYDRKPRKDLPYLSNITLRNVEWHVGSLEPRSLNHEDLIVVSPGVPIDSPWLKEAAHAGSKVISEIEFASQFLSVPMLAVTGTNGKSTTTTLLAHFLKSWGKNVFAGGNLGTPLIEAVGKEYDFLVVEVSSFQLEAVSSFHPHIGVFLNIFPNHLDRHGTFHHYQDAKARLFSNMNKSDVAILNWDQLEVRSIAKTLSSSVQYFSSKEKAVDAFGEGNEIRLKSGDLIKVDSRSLQGSHNVENAMAAVLSARAVGCPLAVIQQALQTFEGLKHRLEEIETVRGVRFVNDSKSTTPEATMVALKSFDVPVIVLLGGRPKGFSYRELARLAGSRKVQCVLYGEAKEIMKADFSESQVLLASGSREAFQLAVKNAKQGTVILFSPANASFDEFENFEARGEAFRSWVKELSCA